MYISLSLNVTELKSLPSYDDINYRLKTHEGLFLLKIFHGEMSANRVRLEEQLNFQYFLKNKVIYHMSQLGPFGAKFFG